MPPAYSDTTHAFTDGEVELADSAADDLREGADRVARTIPMVINVPASYAINSVQERQGSALQAYDLAKRVALPSDKVRSEHRDAEPTAAENYV
jgi:hypothetical protein